MSYQLPEPIERHPSGYPRFSDRQLHEAYSAGRADGVRVRGDLLAGLECAAQLAETDERRKLYEQVVKYVRYMLEAT